MADGDDGIVKNLEKNYEYFNGWTDPGDVTVTEDGTLVTVHDEPLEYWGKFTQDNNIIYIYKYAIVAWVQDGIFKGWTRCD